MTEKEARLIAMVNEYKKGNATLAEGLEAFFESLSKEQVELIKALSPQTKSTTERFLQLLKLKYN